jgi:hypothetical protein
MLLISVAAEAERLLDFALELLGRIVIQVIWIVVQPTTPSSPGANDILQSLFEMIEIHLDSPRFARPYADSWDRRTPWIEQPPCHRRDRRAFKPLARELAIPLRWSR